MTQPQQGPAEPPAPEVDYTLPADGKIDLGDKDYVRFAVQPTTGQFFAVTDAFDRLRDALLADAVRMAEQKRQAQQAHLGAKMQDMLTSSGRPMFEFGVAAVEALAVEAAVRMPDGDEILKTTDRDSLLRWPLHKVLIAAKYAVALKERFGSPGI